MKSNVFEFCLHLPPLQSIKVFPKLRHFSRTPGLLSSGIWLLLLSCLCREIFFPAVLERGAFLWETQGGQITACQSELHLNTHIFYFILFYLQLKFNLYLKYLALIYSFELCFSSTDHSQIIGVHVGVVNFKNWHISLF